MYPPSMDEEFMGMADYLMESFHDLLAGDSETIFNSNSRRGSHHPSHKCFMADTSKGHVESIHEREVTPRLTSTMMLKEMQESRLACR
jgi:hypothetical protein